MSENKNSSFEVPPAKRMKKHFAMPFDSPFTLPEDPVYDIKDLHGKRAVLLVTEDNGYKCVFARIKGKLYFISLVEPAKNRTPPKKNENEDSYI